jgi:hypothetical protein
MPALIFFIFVLLFDSLNVPVTGCRRLGAEDEFEVFCPFIQDTVAELRPYFEALLCFYFDPAFFRFEGGCAFQDEEELAGPLVKMFLLGRVWGHSFHFHGEVRIVGQVPSVTLATPDIVPQRGVFGDRL